MFVFPRLSELVPWSIWDYLPKTAMGTDVFLIGGNPFQHKVYSAWHVKPLGTVPHTKAFRVKRAICENYLDELEEVLDEGFDLESELDPQYGYTALTLAATLNRNNVINYLLLRGADIEGRDSKGQTALMRATAFWQLDSLLALLSNGADIYNEDQFGFNCLEKARMRGLKAVEKLLQEGYKPTGQVLPKSLLKFPFEEAFEDNAKALYEEKKFLKGKFVPYPFNDVEGNYHFLFGYKD